MAPIRRDYDDYVFLGVLNFETDDWEDLAFTLAWDDMQPPSRIRIIDSSGRDDMTPTDVRVRNGQLEFRISHPLTALDFLAIMTDPFDATAS